MLRIIVDGSDVSVAMSDRIELELSVIWCHTEAHSDQTAISEMKNNSSEPGPTELKIISYDRKADYWELNRLFDRISQNSLTQVMGSGLTVPENPRVCLQNRSYESPADRITEQQRLFILDNRFERHPNENRCQRIVVLL